MQTQYTKTLSIILYKIMYIKTCFFSNSANNYPYTRFDNITFELLQFARVLILSARTNQTKTILFKLQNRLLMQQTTNIIHLRVTYNFLFSCHQHLHIAFPKSLKNKYIFINNDLGINCFLTKRRIHLYCFNIIY